MKLTLKITSLFFLLLIAFYGARIFTLRDFAQQSKSQIIAQLEEARIALASLRPSAAATPLTAVNSEVANLRSELERFGVLQVAGFWDKLTDGLKGLPGVVADITGLSGTAVHINDDLVYLRTHGPTLLLTGPGEELLLRLEGLANKLGTLQSYLENVEQNQQFIDTKTKKTLADFEAELTSTREGVAALYSFLNPPAPSHLLLLFQNESELRPAGGFIGSYADVTIASGTIKNIEVRDIYDPDGQLDIKVMPPTPLQRLTRDWEVRDANWFFDYPSSARQVISFLNQSKIYSERGITFNGAVAVNTKVLGDIIGLIGPLHLPDYQTTLTEESFLRELQREVEAGENKKINQPKKILQALAPVIIEELKTQDEADKQKLLERIRYHFAQKNIQLYFDAPALTKKLEALSVTGSVYKGTHPTSTLSDYLAVVSANMAGGKSDYVTRQAITLEGIFTASGTLLHTLRVSRAHGGANETDWWYRAPNKTYTQIYLPLGSRLDGAAGALPFPKAAGWDYKGYKKEPAIAALEQTERFFPDQNLLRFIAFSKTVFAGWITTPPGGASELLLQYRNPRRFEPGVTDYLLVFEKQSGANTSFEASIKAPPGYYWRETGTTFLHYQSENPEGRIFLVGTFQKM